MFQVADEKAAERERRRRARWQSRYKLGELAGTKFPGARMLCGPLIRAGQRTMVAGHTGMGKSTFTLGMCAAIAAGEPFMDMNVRQGKVLVIDLEQDGAIIQRRMQELIFPGTYGELNFANQVKDLGWKDNIQFITLPDGCRLNEEDGVDQEEMNAVIEEYKPKVVVIDPLFKAIQGTVSDDESIRGITDYLDRLRQAHGFAVVLPAHVRKGAGEPAIPAITDIRGAGDLTFGAEIIMAVHRDFEVEGETTIRILKDRNGDIVPGTTHTLELHPKVGWRLKMGRAVGAAATMKEALLGVIPIGKHNAMGYEQLQEEIADKYGMATRADSIRGTMKDLRGQYPDITHTEYMHSPNEPPRHLFYRDPDVMQL